jgi:hypothetical protein
MLQQAKFSARISPEQLAALTNGTLCVWFRLVPSRHRYMGISQRMARQLFRLLQRCPYKKR